MTLPQSLVEKALAQAQKTASHSWEYSTVFHAMLEYQNPELCVFHHAAFTADGGGDDEVPNVKIESVQGLQYVQGFIRTDGDVLCDGNGMLSCDRHELFLSMYCDDDHSHRISCQKGLNTT